MTVYQDIRSISPDLSARDLLRHLILDRFPGKTLVTASLKAISPNSPTRTVMPPSRASLSSTGMRFTCPMKSATMVELGYS